MTIHRLVGGTYTAITLTSEELRKAYEEQQFLYDYDDIENTLAQIKEEKAMQTRYDLKANPMTDKEKSKAASYSRTLQNKYNMDWSFAAEDAIKEILSLRKEPENAD